MWDFLLVFQSIDLKTQYLHGFNDIPGTGVLVILACVGESAKQHKTLVITKMLCPIVLSYTSNP
jgi:hypothetical protein